MQRLSSEADHSCADDSPAAVRFPPRSQAVALPSSPGVLAPDAKRLYSSAVELQEQASRAPESERDALLHAACERYQALATHHTASHTVHYNWGVALSDRAKMRAGRREGRDLWAAAQRQYAAAVNLDPASVLAHNNCGLALQQVAALSSATHRARLYDASMQSFLSAIYLNGEFHRGIYNLGTVIYSYGQDMFRYTMPLKDTSPGTMCSIAATIITLAAAMDPSKAVYRSSFTMVKKLLPLPSLLQGRLRVRLLHSQVNGDNKADHWVWQSASLDTEGLHLNCSISRDESHGMKEVDTTSQDQVDEPVAWGVASYRSLLNKHLVPAAGMQTSTNSHPESGIVLPLHISPEEIIAAEPINDLAMPEGFGMCIGTPSKQHYMIAESKEMRNCWLVSLRALVRMKQMDALDNLMLLLKSHK
mmetsp:Transcript_49800/g.95177  ORF Transcript_49800/g.95177 Transcript_49800/m.95177 type:complete len:419 (+) Transcript_49800:112-1368(+)|eukprot:CAMPEP_0114256362 /NCGR_PEP_ID=MMETSP0058-20121206/18107_1 /TAXON_ID=36894 /ORGANISM="Pyramimonas parkeae, CCMP726" /LENGTH=418 /DNA_ID=CAMNT_0001370913 /DNA_START=99 /DNA_END=1355 /DNA_ORIENTATION=+